MYAQLKNSDAIARIWLFSFVNAVILRLCIWRFPTQSLWSTGTHGDRYVKCQIWPVLNRWPISVKCHENRSSSRVATRGHMDGRTDSGFNRRSVGMWTASEKQHSKRFVTIFCSGQPRKFETKHCTSSKLTGAIASKVSCMFLQLFPLFSLPRTFVSYLPPFRISFLLFAFIW